MGTFTIEPRGPYSLELANGFGFGPRLGARQDPLMRLAFPVDGTALNANSVAALRTMMREAVTAGTADALTDVPGNPVYGKTGTAEYDNNPANTHAWIIGWQGDIAFAVFVEKGGSSSITLPIIKTFLRAL